MVGCPGAVCPDLTERDFMTDAKTGDTVRIHYTGTLADGSTFDSSAGRDPLEFTLGSGQVIPGFDKAVSGMAVGQSQTVDIPAADAYLLKNILHGLRYDGLAAVLGNVRDALTPSGKLLVVEAVVPDDGKGIYPAFLDMQMLVGPGGLVCWPRAFVQRSRRGQ